METLTEDIATKAVHDFFTETPFTFLGSGMSCALDPRFGMPALRVALEEGMRGQALTAQGASEWAAVVASLGRDSDLESAMNAVKDDGLLAAVTDITSAFIAATDRECAFAIANGEAQWPAARLFEKLVETLPSGRSALHVLTPNYDLLLEYSCDVAGIPYANGFIGGVSRVLDWNAVEMSLGRYAQVSRGRTLKTAWQPRKRLCLYKVHGSLDYFFHRGQFVENAAWMWSPPKSAQRVMITPGSSKFETLQRYRRELIETADGAIDKANRFLFLGYGFNDTHLEVYTTRKLVTQGCLGLIVTRDSNPRIEAITRQAKNLWLVCKQSDPSSNGTRVFNAQYSDWVEIPGRRLWDVSELTNTLLGG